MLDDFVVLIFYIFYLKIGLRSLELVVDNVNNLSLFENFYISILYNKNIGNIYIGFLFLFIIVLFE